MSVSFFAPTLGAVELIVLQTLEDPGLLVESAFLRGKLRTYKPFEDFSTPRFHQMMGRLCDDGLVIKVRTPGKKAVGYQVTADGVQARTAAISFFSSL